MWADLPLQTVTLGVILAVAILAYLGAEKALKAQLPLLLLVFLSIMALGVGALLSSKVDAIPLNGGTGDVGFWKGFAVFFPAVTGVKDGACNRDAAGSADTCTIAAPIATVVQRLTMVTIEAPIHRWLRSCPVIRITLHEFWQLTVL